MAFSQFPFSASWRGFLVLFITLLSTCGRSLAENSNQWIQTTDSAGNTIYLADNRKPALYTQNFGDCQGDSLINVTRFDAAYYKDNMTVVFHLAGNTAVKNESLMLFIGVFAYGESRFDLTFNPCNANIYSLCPMNASVPIEASGIIPVAQSDVAGIPAIALSIPDFEGQAILRIFANSTQSQIGCYSAVVTNGATFSQPAAVGTILGIFTIVALCASLAVAVYGEHIPTTRNHYAHSLSIFVVFSVFHHIFFTGALSMNWPSVLVAFWSNFAWSAGMIYSDAMQNSINQLIGSNRGNISTVGAAPSGVNANNLGGGYQISQIYKRAVSGVFLPGMEGEFDQFLRRRRLEHAIEKRTLVNSTSGYSWYGAPVKPGLPLPGNFSGFAGTLAEESIPASNAFLTGFLWLLILVAITAASIAILKWSIEGLSRVKVVKTERLAFFRAHWLGFMGAAILRALFIAFFMIVFLTLFQFTLGGSAGVTAIAAVVFTIFFAGMTAIAIYALFYRLRLGKFASEPDRLNLERKRKFGVIPWYGFWRESKRGEKHEHKISAGSLPWWGVRFIDSDPERPNVIEDEDYQKKFGWLAARFRKSKWWFFAPWLVYEFVRACFYGGAAGHPMTQVFGLLAIEFIALVAIIAVKPFEGARLNALMVYFLGFSKVSTVALSSAFDARFNLARITTTAIGIVIIVIQGILKIFLMIAIVVGAISSYLSITRNREEFKPRKWAGIRTRYFAHIDQTATDLPPPPKPPPAVPEEPKEPYFRVASVKRCPKIEDEDEDYVAAMNGSRTSFIPEARESRTGSLRSQISYSSLPFGARPHRASWNSRDFNYWHDEQGNRVSGPLSRMSDASLKETAMKHRASSRAGPSRSGTPRSETPLEVKKQRSRHGKEKEVDVDSGLMKDQENPF